MLSGAARFVTSGRSRRSFQLQSGHPFTRQSVKARGHTVPGPGGLLPVEITGLPLLVSVSFSVRYATTPYVRSRPLQNVCSCCVNMS